MSVATPQVVSQVTFALRAASHDLSAALERISEFLANPARVCDSEDSWWAAFSLMYENLERHVGCPIALEIAVDKLLSQRGITQWSIARFALAR